MVVGDGRGGGTGGTVVGLNVLGEVLEAVVLDGDLVEDRSRPGCGGVVTGRSGDEAAGVVGRGEASNGLVDPGSKDEDAVGDLPSRPS